MPEFVAWEGPFSLRECRARVGLDGGRAHREGPSPSNRRRRRLRPQRVQYSAPWACAQSSTTGIPCASATASEARAFSPSTYQQPSSTSSIAARISASMLRNCDLRSTKGIVMASLCQKVVNAIVKGTGHENQDEVTRVSRSRQAEGWIARLVTLGAPTILRNGESLVMYGVPGIRCPQNSERPTRNEWCLVDI